jgi:hypothetical protein
MAINTFFTVGDMADIMPQTRRSDVVEIEMRKIAGGRLDSHPVDGVDC